VEKPFFAMNMCESLSALWSSSLIGFKKGIFARHICQSMYLGSVSAAFLMQEIYIYVNGMRWFK